MTARNKCVTGKLVENNCGRRCGCGKYGCGAHICHGRCGISRKHNVRGTKKNVPITPYEVIEPHAPVFTTFLRCAALRCVAQHRTNCLQSNFWLLRTIKSN